MMLNYQSNNILACLVLLLLVALNQAAHATDNFIIGTVFDSTQKYDAINSALKQYYKSVEDGNYSDNCDDAIRQTKKLITSKKVQIILSVKDDGCSTNISQVVKNSPKILHISLQFIFLPPPTYSLTVKSFGCLPTKQSAYIVLQPAPPPSPTTDLINKIIDLYYNSNCYDPPATHKVVVSFAHLREKPAYPGKNPDGKIIAYLKKDDSLEGNDVIKDTSKIKNYCKRDAEKNLIYDYIYTVDWMCVKVVSSNNSSNKGKTGWIHKMLVGQLH